MFLSVQQVLLFCSSAVGIVFHQNSQGLQVQVVLYRARLFKARLVPVLG